MIGWDGCGNNFAIDLGQAAPPVLFWDHEVAVASVKGASLEQYIADVLTYAVEHDPNDPEHS